MIQRMQDSQQRAMLKAFVRPSAKRAVEDLVGRTGMTQQEVVSRIYDWFGSQDEVIQHAVLGLLPAEYAQDIASLVLKRIASGQPDSSQTARSSHSSPREPRLVVEGPNEPRANRPPKKRKPRK